MERLNRGPFSYGLLFQRRENLSLFSTFHKSKYILSKNSSNSLQFLYEYRYVNISNSTLQLDTKSRPWLDIAVVEHEVPQWTYVRVPCFAKKFDFKAIS